MHINIMYKSLASNLVPLYLIQHGEVFEYCNDIHTKPSELRLMSMNIYKSKSMGDYNLIQDKELVKKLALNEDSLNTMVPK